MFHTLFVIYLLINIIDTQTNNQCSLLNNKLTKHKIHINNQEKKDFLGLRLCQGLINDYCCPQIYEDKIQNATAIELYHLFELYSINLYESLLRLNIQLNDTIIKLIESSRNETHFILEYGYKTFYNSYRSSIDLFYNNLFKLSYKNYHHNIKNNIEELFHNILHITIQLNNNNNNNKSILSCLWKNHPFGNRPNLIANKLEINLEKLFHLNQLFKLTIELIQTISTSVTTDYHCIDSFMQLSYCNLCAGQKELPCLSNCINVIESCLVNVSLINDIWINFIDSLENVVYFNGIENGLLSIGISIFDSLITFFNSDGIENKDIIDQCGDIHIQKEIFDNDQKFSDKYSNSLSTLLLDRQIMSMKQSLEIYRSFWLMLPREICKSNEISASNEKICWTGTSISQDTGEIIQINYDKPLSLRLQWILKEMKEKSQIIGNIQRTTTTTTDLHINDSSSSTTTIKNFLLINELKLNLTNDFDDYPNDNDNDYSDYAYEDSIEESTTITSSTTIQSSTSSIYDDISIDDINTVSYYDYGEQDVYIDNEFDEKSTQQTSTISTTTIIRIPSYHQRQPIIWNINIDDDFDQQIKQQEQHNSSSFLNYSFLLLLLLLLIFILT